MTFYDEIDKPERATELIRKAAEQAPENLSLRASLANRLETTGDDAGAEKVLLEAVESFKSAGAWNLLANHYRRTGQSEKALAAIEKVIELSGDQGDQLRFIARRRADRSRTSSTAPRRWPRSSRSRPTQA